MNTIQTMLHTIEIQPSQHSPQVYMNAETGEIAISGNSYMPDSDLFYSELLTWVRDYVATKPAYTHVKLFFQYIDSRTSKQLFMFFQELEQLNYTGSKLKIKWTYEKDDDDMFEIIDMITGDFKLDVEIAETEE